MRNGRSDAAWAESSHLTHVLPTSGLGGGNVAHPVESERKVTHPMEDGRAPLIQLPARLSETRDPRVKSSGGI